MNIRGFRIMPVTASVIMVLATGCASASSAASSAAPPDPELASITVGALPATDLAGLYIAEEQGLFARQGLHVTIEPIASSEAVITAQLKGQVDIGAGSYIPYLAAQAAGARFRILAQASTLKPDTRVLVTAGNSPVETVGQLVGKKIGVNGTNSVGTLLVSMLLADNGISPAKVRFVTDPQGFPAMPARLQAGAWTAAFLAEPYITYAGEKYGEQILADLDQGSAVDFPIDGYVATTAWAQKYPKTTAAFVRAIEAAQSLADTNSPMVQTAIAKYDNLGRLVTSSMALSGYPTGPVARGPVQRVALAMLQFGMLGPQYTPEVDQGTLVRSMIG
jgi:NitT/TauT family transport system substrate-binding protein